MALNFILKDIKSILVAYGYNADEIILQTIGAQTSENTSLQSSIFIIADPTNGNYSNYQVQDISLYIRRPNPDDVNIVAEDIYHKLHGRRGGAGTVANNFNKILLIQAISKPFAYSTTTSGSNTTEYVIKFRVQYIDTGFDNF